MRNSNSERPRAASGGEPGAVTHYALRIAFTHYALRIAFTHYALRIAFTHYALRISYCSTSDWST